MTVQAADAGRSAAAYAGPPPGEVYIVEPGDTLSAIAQAHGISLTSLEQANPHLHHPDLIRPGQAITLPSHHAEPAERHSAPQTYTVQPGDTLSGIAGRFGTSWRALAQLDHLSNPNLIRPGQTLAIGQAAGAEAHYHAHADRSQASGWADTTQASAAAGRAGPHHHHSHAAHPTDATDPTTTGETTTGQADARGAASAEIARRHLGQGTTALQHSGALPMDPGCNAHKSCANFVSAVLVQAGQLPAHLHTDAVHDLNHTLRYRGWTEVPASQARAGDVAIMPHHTELVTGPGEMIGSNNRHCSGLQHITTNNTSYAEREGGVFLRAPVARNAGSSPAGSTPPNPGYRQAAPTTEARSTSRVGHAHGHTPPAEIVSAAQRTQTEWGVPASVTIAQWMLESGWGRHMPQDSNNPFGIKAGRGQPSVSATTHEEVNGRMVRITAQFRKFDSLDEAFSAHGRLLATHPAYAQARTHLNDPDAYADALTHHYATDSGYGRMLRQEMRAYNLHQFDQVPASNSR